MSVFVGGVVMVGGKIAPAGGAHAPLVLAAAGSHLYPGARGSIGGGAGAGTCAGPCVVEFADGSLAFGRLAPTADGLTLELDGYTTARGTEIPAKRWGLELRHEGGAQRFRVRARLG